MKGKTLLLLLFSLLLVLGLGGGIGGFWEEARAEEPEAPGETRLLASPVGTAFTYQGRLVKEGNPVDDTCDFQFSLYDAASGGSQVGTTQTKTNVSVSDGVFTVQLDFGGSAFQGDARWLKIEVRCPAGNGSYTTLSPRQPLTATPYALYATTAPWSGLTGAPACFADGVDDNTTYTAGTGLTLVGTTFNVVEGSGSGLDADLLDGQQASAFATASHDHWDETWTGTGTGLTLSGGSTGFVGSGSAYGVYAEGGHTGVYGSGNSYGVYGSSTSGYGVLGSSSSSYGVYAEGGHTGVHGSGSNYGIYGWSPDGFGVSGYSSSNYGVYGSSTSSYGVSGESTSSYGVSGYSGGSYGVYGSGGRGVYGTGATYGVYGSSTSSGGYGVYGSGDTYGVLYSGGLAGTGSKSAIVETEDYAWRHLYAMESPEVWFEDFGQAQLVDGQAVVAIEPIFAQTVNLTETYHVFLTPLGDCGLYVSQKSLTSFTVEALGGQSCNIAFDYRIIAKRLGYEDQRLEPGEDPSILAQEMEIQQEGP